MGHRINPIGLRLNITQSWDTLVPSKTAYINDFLFKYFFFKELYGFFSKRWVSDLRNKFILKNVKKLQKSLQFKLEKKFKDLPTEKKVVLYQLFFFKKYLSSRRAIRQKEDQLFFHIQDIYLSLNKDNIYLDYCLFQKIMGNINLKFYFKMISYESELFNFIRFSQKWLKLKLFSLSIFKIEKVRNAPRLMDDLLYYMLYRFDFENKQNYFFTFSKNYSNKFYYLYSLFLNISQSFINYYLRTYNYYFYFFRKFLISDLKYLSKYKNINIECNLTSFSFSTGDVFGKYIKYRLAKYESFGRVVQSFFRNIFKIYRNVYNTRALASYSNFSLKKKSRKFYLMDSFVDLSGFIEIFGIKVKGSGRFTKKRRVRSLTFSKGGLPLNKFHKNITLNLSEIRFKYGIAGVKLWIYKAPNSNFSY